MAKRKAKMKAQKRRAVELFAANSPFRSKRVVKSKKLYARRVRSNKKDF